MSNQQVTMGEGLSPVVSKPQRSSGGGNSLLTYQPPQKRQSQGGKIVHGIPASAPSTIPRGPPGLQRPQSNLPGIGRGPPGLEKKQNGGGHGHGRRNGRGNRRGHGSNSKRGRGGWNR